MIKNHCHKCAIKKYIYGHFSLDPIVLVIGVTICVFPKFYPSDLADNFFLEHDLNHVNWEYLVKFKLSKSALHTKGRSTIFPI